MAKFLATQVLDAACSKIATSTKLSITSSQPANFAAIAAANLANLTVAPGDFTTSVGDVNGRKVRVAAKTGIAVTANGTATHICLDDGTTLLAVTTCTSQALTSGNTVNTPVFDFEFSDPT